jgi:V-ATPase subunit C
MSSNDADYERISMKGLQVADDPKLQDVYEFWLISAPGDPTVQQTWDALNKATSKQNGLTTNYKLHIPDLKVYSTRYIHWAYNGPI